MPRFSSPPPPPPHPLPLSSALAPSRPDADLMNERTNPSLFPP
uniref:Uncharacterized protein n=1 Tax=Triticum urartu TaxID=4572 RepID=A0A8R7P5G5_TRIUA